MPWSRTNHRTTPSPLWRRQFVRQNDGLRLGLFRIALRNNCCCPRLQQRQVAEDAADGYRQNGRRRWTPAEAGKDHTQTANYVRVCDWYVRITVQGGRLPETDVRDHILKLTFDLMTIGRRSVISQTTVMTTMWTHDAINIIMLITNNDNIMKLDVVILLYPFITTYYFCWDFDQILLL